MLGDFLDALFSDSGAPDRYYHRPSEGVESLDSKARAREVATDIAFLKQKVERLMMITEALWIVLKETTNYTDEDLKEIILEVDMKDGKLDGKVAAEAPGAYPNCGKTLQKNKRVCIYCGAKIGMQDVFQR